MKRYIATFVLFWALITVGTTQTSPSLEEQFTTLWKQSNYAGLRSLLDTKSAASPPDVVALYCSKFFYVFVQPDKAKALAELSKLKELAQATSDADFIAFADAELAEVQRIPDAPVFQATPEILASFHTEFPDQYPNLNLAMQLRKYIH